LCVFDGEKKDGEYLHRDVALLPINSSLDGKEKTIARYKTGKRIDSAYINISGFQTPTLEYIRQKWK